MSDTLTNTAFPLSGVVQKLITVVVDISWNKMRHLKSKFKMKTKTHLQMNSLTVIITKTQLTDLTLRQMLQIIALVF